MAIRFDSPQVAVLLKKAEEEFGKPISTPSDFLLVADKIEAKTRQHISDSTIKRLWKPNLGYATISERTLNVISQYVGYPHFNSFTTSLSENEGVESEFSNGGDCVKSSFLDTGDIVEIAWMPDRECQFQYLGQDKFKVIESKNSKISKGDTFYCNRFHKGKTLFVDNLFHDGTIIDSYAMGTEHGLTRLVLKKV